MKWKATDFASKQGPLVYTIWPDNPDGTGSWSMDVEFTGKREQGEIIYTRSGFKTAKEAKKHAESIAAPPSSKEPR